MTNRPQAINLIRHAGQLTMANQNDELTVSASYMRLDVNAIASFQPINPDVTLGTIIPFYRSMQIKINDGQFFNLPITVNNTNSYIAAGIEPTLRYESVITYSLNIGNPLDNFSDYNKFSLFSIKVDYSLIPAEAGLISAEFTYQLMSGGVGLY